VYISQTVTYTLPAVVDPNGETATITIVTTLPSFITWVPVAKAFSINPTSAS